MYIYIYRNINICIYIHIYVNIYIYLYIFGQYPASSGSASTVLGNSAFDRTSWHSNWRHKSRL